MARPTTVYAASQGKRFAADTTLIVVQCYSRGCTYAIPESFDRSARRYHGGEASGWWICCPFGHTWGYTGETKEESLQRHLDNARDEAARTRARLDQTEASLRGTRTRAARTTKELKRTKDRVKNGVCPCCNRTFAQLQRHMKRQHPDYVDAA